MDEKIYTKLDMIRKLESAKADYIGKTRIKYEECRRALAIEGYSLNDRQDELLKELLGIA